jgi:pimeloyl-ACP methyl ester carboxylesterase
MTSPGIERRVARVDGLRMSSRVSSPDGPGMPLVLVHGLGVSSRYMVPLMKSLGPGRPVHAPDLPGFGRSGSPPRTLDVHGLAESLRAWMAVEGLDRTVLLGHSLGCQVVADLAFHHPRLVDRLILAAPTIDDSERGVARELVRLLRDALREPLSLFPVVATAYLRAGFRRLLRTLRYALADPIEEKLPAIEIPALVVHGGRDPVVSGPWAEKVAGLLPRGRLAVLPRAAHALQFSAPDELAALLRLFLAGGLGGDL